MLRLLILTLVAWPCCADDSGDRHLHLSDQSSDGTFAQELKGVLQDFCNTQLPDTFALDQEQLQQLETATNQIISFRTEGNVTKIEIDRLRWRREVRVRKEAVRTQLSGWFPKLAAKSAQRYGLAVYHPDQTDGVSLADTTPPVEAILTLHGLDDTGRIWRNFIAQAGAEAMPVCTFDYANDQPIKQSAKDLASALGDLQRAGVQRVHLVAHSMGGLVCRQYLATRSTEDAAPEILQLITVGTPHAGSALARVSWPMEVKDQLVRTCSGEGVLFGSFFDGMGEARRDLAPGSPFLSELNKAPWPALPITCIAGVASPITQDDVAETAARIRQLAPDAMANISAEVRTQLNKLVAGVGDGCVPLQSAHPGVADQPVVQGNHISMLLRLGISKKTPTAIPVILDRLAKHWQTDRSE